MSNVSHCQVIDNRWLCFGNVWFTSQCFIRKCHQFTKVTPLSKDARKRKKSRFNTPASVCCNHDRQPSLMPKSYWFSLRIASVIDMARWLLFRPRLRLQLLGPHRTPKCLGKRRREKYGEILSIQLAPRELEVLKTHQTWKRKSVAGFFSWPFNIPPCKVPPWEIRV